MRKSSNLFISIIYNKVKLSPKTLFKYISNTRSAKKLRKNIIKGSPSFGLLWKISDFITYAEEIFFYDNSTKNIEIGLYSSRSFPDGTNGFKINTTECNITIKLFSDTQRVVVEVDRKIGERLKSYLAFTNDEWENEPSIVDEMLLEQIIRIINNKTIDLFNWCYNKQ